MIYFVSTPIGNLKDITLRALESLKEADYICCEDTRNTSVLLNNYDIKKKLISFHQHNELERSREIIEWAREGKNICIVSDAGMPGISDPGSKLIVLLIEEGIDYTVLPGPSAFTTALVYSGLNSEVFKFVGFLAPKGKERKEKLQMIKDEENTVILYEAPHKLDKTMEDLMEIIPDRTISVVRELTKIYEEHINFKISDYPDQDFVKKGEMVLVIGPDESIETPSELAIEDLLKDLIESGMRKSEAAAQVAEEYGLKKNFVYDISKNL